MCNFDKYVYDTYFKFKLIRGNGNQASRIRTIGF